VIGVTTPLKQKFHTKYTVQQNAETLQQKKRLLQGI